MSKSKECPECGCKILKNEERLTSFGFKYVYWVCENCRYEIFTT
jgi:predicted site-specific integrase-resolvase